MLVDSTPGKSKNQQDQDTYRMIYLFPKQIPGVAQGDIGVLGGTYIEGATSQTPNEEEFALMVHRAREFYGVS
ncbi:MAG: hypothetical protein HYX61_00175 [Gammaproteobacteria bacterium]|nr:hypothetical protein [Gammaproteobacteria bacterium]